MQEPYERLAQAIVTQAAKDYVSSLRKINRYKKDSDKALAAEKMLDETNRFFHSGWFSMLCNLDGEKLVKMLRKETGYDS